MHGQTSIKFGRQLFGLEYIFLESCDSLELNVRTENYQDVTAYHMLYK